MIKKICKYFLLFLLLISIITINPISSKNIDKSSYNSTLYVGGSGPGNYTGYDALRRAYSDAVSGDRIFIYNGEYKEYINIEKQIILQGESKYNSILLYEIKISCDNVTIKNLKLTRYSDTQSGNIGLKINGNNTKIIDNYICNFTAQSANNGKGIDLSSGFCNNLISDNIFENNTAAAVYINKNSNNNIITNNEIFNTCSNGIRIDSYSNDNIISGNTITNTRQGSGVGVYGYALNNLITNNILRENEMGLDVQTRCGNNNFTNNLIEDNEIGIRIHTSDNNSFTYNLLKNNEKGLSLYYSYDNFIKNNDFISNTKDTDIKKRGTDDIILSILSMDTNTFSENYWGHSRIFPKFIIGKIEIPPIIIITVKFIVEIDWQPAKTLNCDF